MPREMQVIGRESKAAILGHPIHPMLIPFPIAFLVGAFLTDLAFWATDDFFFARASLWLTGAGVVGGLAAAVFGATDFLSIKRVRDYTGGWVHAIGNVMAVTLALISWLLRLGDAAEAVLPWGLVLSAVWSAILGVTGWYGGELSYHLGIGVVGEREPGRGEPRPGS